MKNLFKKSKKIRVIVLTLPLLFVIAVCVNLSYAATTCNFATNDDTLNAILTGATSGKPCPTGNQLLALIGICPADADTKINPLCSAFTGTRVTQCQAFYKQAYYGKVRAACNYLANVKSANDNYTAPPPKPRS